MHRKIRQQRLAIERELRKENTYNGRRKGLYPIIAVPDRLSDGDLFAYRAVRAHIINQNPYTKKELPYTPSKNHYDLARRLLTN